MKRSGKDKTPPGLLFVDTAGWMMLADAADPLHERARRCRDEWLERGGLLLSSNFVMDETLTLLRVRLGLRAAEAWWNQVDSSARLQWSWVEEELAEKARKFFFKHRDKPFSFTDCTSFAIMGARKLRIALTSDRHFVQAGFEVLPGGARAR